MRTLVVGGAGFIGRWTVAAFLDRGFQVRAFDDLSNGRIENLDAFGSHAGFLGLCKGSTTDPSALAAVFEEGPWDIIVHLGMSSSVQRAIDEPASVFRNDVAGTLSLLEACRRQVPMARVVLVSTSLVYAAAELDPTTEDHPCRPASPYAAMRLAIEGLGTSYALSYGLWVTVLRPFNIYGPFQKASDGVVAAFLRRDLDRLPITIKGSGEQTRDLLYVEDFADLVARAATRDEAAGETFNGGSGHDVSVRMLSELCVTEGNDVRLIPHDHPQAEVARQCADVSRARTILHWSPQVSLREGIERTRAWLASR